MEGRGTPVPDCMKGKCFGCCCDRTGAGVYAAVQSYEVPTRGQKLPTFEKYGLTWLSLKPDGSCAMLDWNKGCLAYEDRPDDCRFFPLLCAPNGDVLLGGGCTQREAILSSIERKEEPTMKWLRDGEQFFERADDEFLRRMMNRAAKYHIKIVVGKARVWLIAETGQVMRNV